MNFKETPVHIYRISFVCCEKLEPVLLLQQLLRGLLLLAAVVVVVVVVVVRTGEGSPEQLKHKRPRWQQKPVNRRNFNNMCYMGPLMIEVQIRSDYLASYLFNLG